MKKIGIITLFGYHNYGNRLQNYAVQKILEELGFEVETIKTRSTWVAQKPSLLQKIQNNKNSFLKKIVSKFLKIKYRELNEKRLKKFETFSKKYINETTHYITNDYIPETLDNEYDFFVTGSDQVWNPFLRGTDIEFLKFASAQKRVAFSASFGTSFIPENRSTDFANALNDMSSISVREIKGKEIVEELTDRTDIELLVDPTMLLNAEEWLVIISDSKPQTQKYILVYFLGGKSRDYRNFINQISIDQNLKIIELLNPKLKDYYITDPAEFVELINNAEVICTDSFHGAAFSITLNKPFVVFDRIESQQPSMNSRITTLLEKFHLENRYWSKDYKVENVFDAINYEQVNEILKQEKHKAINFLKKALV